MITIMSIVMMIMKVRIMIIKSNKNVNPNTRKSSPANERVTPQFFACTHKHTSRSPPVSYPDTPLTASSEHACRPPFPLWSTEDERQSHAAERSQCHGSTRWVRTRVSLAAARWGKPRKLLQWQCRCVSWSIWEKKLIHLVLSLITTLYPCSCND